MRSAPAQAALASPDCPASAPIESGVGKALSFDFGEGTIMTGEVTMRAPLINSGTALKSGRPWCFDALRVYLRPVVCQSASCFMASRLAEQDPLRS